jgi:opacity protein-like surface antigen
MKSLLVSLLIAVSLVGFTPAQNKMYVGASALVALPIGDFGDLAGTGFGGLGSFEISFMPQLVGIGQIGYISWGGKDFGDLSYGYSAVPILFGVKYYFTPSVPFYGTASLGFHILNANAEYQGNELFSGFDVSGSSTEFSFILGAGYEVPVSPKVSLDFAGTFNIVSDANYIGIRAGGKFAL